MIFLLNTFITLECLTGYRSTKFSRLVQEKSVDTKNDDYQLRLKSSTYVMMSKHTVRPVKAVQTKNIYSTLSNNGHY